MGEIVDFDEGAKRVRRKHAVAQDFVNSFFQHTKTGQLSYLSAEEYKDWEEFAVVSALLCSHTGPVIQEDIDSVKESMLQRYWPEMDQPSKIHE